MDDTRKHTAPSNLIQAQTKFLENSQRWQDIIQYAAVGMYRVAESGKFHLVNPKLAQIFGYASPEEFLSSVSTISELYINPGDREPILKAMNEKGPVDGVEAPFRHRNGGTIWIQISARAISREGDETVYEGFMVDVTGKRRSNEQILRQSRLLRAINRVFQGTLKCNTMQEVAVICLEVAEWLTDSQFGWIGEINSRGRMDTVALSDPGWSACRIGRPDATVMIQNMELRSFWGKVIRNKQALIVNDPSTHPGRIGFPEGHPLVTAFLGVPLKHRGKTFGIISLGNKTGGYDAADREDMETLSVAVTEALNRKRAERELEKSEERFRAIFESVSDCIVVWDRNHTYLYANEAALQHFKISKDRVIGKNIREGLENLPDLVNLWAKRIDQVFKTKNILRVEDTFPGRDQWVHIESIFSPIMDAGGDMFAVGVVYRDMTQRKVMEQQIRDGLELNEKTISASTLGIVAFDDSGQCVLANEAAAKIAGATRPQLLEQNFRSLRSLKRSGLLKAAEAVLSDGKERQLETKLVTTFGKSIWLDSHLVRFTRSGRSHLLHIFADITERKQMEEGLQQAREKLEENIRELENANRHIVKQQKSVIEEERLKVLLQMAGATAHELNQPLTYLLGNIELMELYKDDPERRESHISKIRIAGRRIADIVKKIQIIHHDETKGYTGGSTIMNLDQAIKILSVENKEADFENLRSALKENDKITLIQERSIEKALRRLEKEKVDMIFLDFLLPDGSGLDFLDKLKQTGKDIPVVTITGQGDEMIALRMVQAGAFDYLPKSRVTEHALLRIITNTLEKHCLKKEVKLAMDKMAQLSTRDALTGLYNRRYFEEALERELARADRYEIPLVLCMLDLDHFKYVNDTYGHPVGDRVLSELGRMLRESFRQSDLLCRYGGEEFALILPNTSLEMVKGVCDRFRNKFGAHPFADGSVEFHVTISIGVAAFDADRDMSAASLIQRADRALYQAKREGRNRIVLMG